MTKKLWFIPVIYKVWSVKNMKKLLLIRVVHSIDYFLHNNLSKLVSDQFHIIEIIGVVKYYIINNILVYSWL